MSEAPDWTAWERGEWKRWHRARERALAAPYGWLSITSLQWLDETPRQIEGFPGLWSGDCYEVRVDLTPEDAVLQHGEPVSGTVDIPLAEDESDDSLFHAGIVAEAGIRGGRPMVRLRDPQAPVLTGFEGVRAYDWDETWVLPAHFRAYQRGNLKQALLKLGWPAEDFAGYVDGEAHAIKLDESDWTLRAYQQEVVREVDTAHPDVRQPMAFWGEVTFTRDDQDVTLQVSGGHGNAFVVFHDSTNGVDTADWRFVELGEIDPVGGTTLDFNRALNYPAAFLPGYATCPRPVPENEVPFPVTAGEMRP